LAYCWLSHTSRFGPRQLLLSHKCRHYFLVIIWWETCAICGNSLSCEAQGHTSRVNSVLWWCASVAVTQDDIIEQHFARFDEKFFHYCDKELLKINTFFSGTYICSYVFVQFCLTVLSESNEILSVVKYSCIDVSYHCATEATKVKRQVMVSTVNMLHCRVLPLGEFSSMISEPLPVSFECCDSFRHDHVMLMQLHTKLYTLQQTQSTENDTFPTCTTAWIIKT